MTPLACQELSDQVHRARAERAARRRGEQAIAMANACEVCGWRPPLLTGISAVMHEHHVIPRAQGGSDGWWNSVRLCPNHHSIAHVALYGGRVAGDLYRPRSAAHLIAALRLLDRLPSEEQRA